MSSGRRVSYIPPGERKSGIPEATEMPAPVKTPMDWHSSDRMNRANDLTSLGKWRLLEADTDMILRAFLRAGAGRTDTMLMDLCRRMDRVKGEVIIPGKKETNDSATAQKFQSSVSTTNHKRELNPFFHRISLYCGLIPQLGASLDLFFFRRKS